MKALITLLIFSAIFTGCTTMSPPQVRGNYSFNQNMPTVGLNVIDAREGSKVGTIGLASYSIEDLELYLYETLKNQINEVSGINLQKYDELTDFEVVAKKLSGMANATKIQPVPPE